MPAVLTEAPLLTATAATAQPPRKRWTRADLGVMESVGLNLSGYELIEGDLINKMGKNWPHVTAAALMHRWLVSIFGSLLALQEAPIDVSALDNPTSEPQPDLIVLNREVTLFGTSKPKPDDLQLVVEISDSTLAFDKGVKAALYARASIAEYWVLDVSGRTLTVHREPREGFYASIAVYAEDESVAPLAAPEHEFAVAAAFPVDAV